MVDSKLRHRILGVFVIAGLIIIAIPLFHRYKTDKMDNPLNNTPTFPDQSVQVESLESSGPVAMRPANEAQTMAFASGWVVQLGSFKNKVNALRLVNQLRADGYHAFLDSNHALLTRVYVGPENKKSDASLLAEQVNRKTHLQGIIVNYNSLTL